MLGAQQTNGRRNHRRTLSPLVCFHTNDENSCVVVSEASSSDIPRREFTSQGVCDIASRITRHRRPAGIPPAALIGRHGAKRPPAEPGAAALPFCGFSSASPPIPRQRSLLDASNPLTRARVPDPAQNMSAKTGLEIRTTNLYQGFMWKQGKIAKVRRSSLACSKISAS